MSGFVPFQALMASAGSGKTFSLVVRYLGLLFMGGKADEILALTFTNKAASEMQERIIETLLQLPQRDELAAIAALCETTPEAILARREAVLQEVLAADTKVMTIDSFFAKVLRKFALHAGIMPNFGTFEAQHALKVTARFLRLCAIEGKESTLVNMALLTSRRLSDIFALLDELYAKWPQLQHLQFEAANMGVWEQEAMQLHAQLLAAVEGKPLSERGRKALQAEGIDALIEKSWLTKPTMEYWDFKKIYTPQMDAIQQQLQAALKGYMQAKEQQFFAHLFELLELYRSAKLTVAKEDNELAFDDITVLVYYLLKERIDSEFLYFRLDSRISHLLLDEFQDTSVLQFEILRPLVEEMRSGSGVREARSFFLVGDVKQSIYRFRGGTKELFGAVTQEYGLQVDSLRTNYRSSGAVVSFVNTVFRGKIPGYEDQAVKPGAGGGYVEVVQSDAVLEQMGETVRRLLSLGAEGSDIAVLTATNGDGDAVQEFLASLGIDVVTETTSKLINQKRVRALIEYLKYCYFGEAIYARNFCSLADLEPQPLQRLRIERGGVAEAAQAVVRDFALFDGDLNIIRFIEMLARYPDMEAFLFEYERLDTKAVSAEASGVRVLTVHKSKGLEYPYVIVMDRLGRKHSDTAPIIYDYKGVALRGLFLRQKNRKELDLRYAAALEREAALAEDDALNALYVAFTRAREGLYILRKPKESMFGILGLSALSQGSEAVKRTQKKRTELEESIAFTALKLGRQSEIVASESGKEGGDDPFAVTYGLALHYTLEMMEAFTPEALRQALAATANRYGALLDEPVFLSIAVRVERLLEDARFAQLCRGEIRREQPLSFEGELRYVDLLVKQEEKWIVIDYKSAFSHTPEHHRQVAFYVRAVEAITGERAEGYLCYLLENEVKIVPV